MSVGWRMAGDGDSSNLLTSGDGISRFPCPSDLELPKATIVAGPYPLITTISPYTASYHTDPQRFFMLGNEN